MAALAVVAALLAPAACSGSGSDTAQQPTIRDVVRRAIERAKEARNGESGRASSQPTPTSTLGTSGRTAFDYASYQRTVSGTLGLLEEYWRATLPSLGGSYRPLAGYTYYRSDQGGGPTCGGQPAPQDLEVGQVYQPRREHAAQLRGAAGLAGAVGGVAREGRP